MDNYTFTFYLSSLVKQPLLSHIPLQKILPYLSTDYSVFTSLDFATIIFLPSKVISHTSNPQHGGWLLLQSLNLDANPVVLGDLKSLFLENKLLA
jgi:hypothetical protein